MYAYIPFAMALILKGNCLKAVGHSEPVSMDWMPYKCVLLPLLSLFGEDNDLGWGKAIRFFFYCWLSVGYIMHIYILFRQETVHYSARVIGYEGKKNSGCFALAFRVFIKEGIVGCSSGQEESLMLSKWANVNKFSCSRKIKCWKVGCELELNISGDHSAIS